MRFLALLLLSLLAGMPVQAEMCIGKKTFASVLDKAILRWQGVSRDGSLLMLFRFPEPLPGNPMPGAWTIYRYSKDKQKACVVDFGPDSYLEGVPDLSRFGTPMEKPKL